MGRHGRPRVGRHCFTEDTKRNALFEEYYQGQCIVSESEWPAFMYHLQQDLPITFRVTGFREQNKELLRLIKYRYREEISQITFPSSEDGQSHKHIAFKALPWYPDELAWQLDTNRFVVRKTPELKVLHQFLVSEMESGNISRQEAVSMLPPLVLDVRSYHAVLDLCAAPGSKSAQLVELLHADAESQCITEVANEVWPYSEPTGMVIANDVDQKRCYMMVHQVKRLQSPCTMITQEDATCFPKLYVPQSSTEKDQTTVNEQFLFDRVLADVPCSGDGTLRKNPDLWLRWNPNLGISEHYLQLRILRRGLELLRDHCANGQDYGRLVYSTCSFNPLENEAVVANMLHACQGSVRLVEPDKLPSVTLFKTEAEPNRFLVRPGLTKWRVMNKKGCWFDKFEDVPPSQHSNIRPSLFPPEDVSELHLERCMRIVPHDQNTGGFFLAVLEKIAPLPWMKQARRTFVATDAAVESELGVSAGNPGFGEITVSEKSADPNQSGKRPHDPQTNTNKEEPKKPRVFSENPFTYIDPVGDTEWHGIRDYYGISEMLHPDDFSPPSDRRFPPSHLLYRSTKEELRRRQFYYTNGLIKRIIESNSARGLKIVSSGVRLFSIMEDKQFNGYRLLQDGVDLADAFLPARGGRRIRLTAAEYPDLVLLLQEEMPLISRMTSSTQAQWSVMNPGPVLIEYCPSSDGEPLDSNLPQCRLVFAGWRGVKSLRHYIGRHERLHLMRLANLEPKPAIMGHTTQMPNGGDGPVAEEISDGPSEAEPI
ncbi:tRNA (cytosine(34)-C(5))-methyltransferase [Clonorchis sinensis]|uniref:tRNA (cytosine(34)-C(5))-methyltransferase n=1 Tax=Clonorchis sinensis TaxID=79923 RepID=A0A8T1LYI8_CLOSI|nr:tRNA (cytosine(34)-C(5))-methyltransferase [Clonorchis sinensis]